MLRALKDLFDRLAPPTGAAGPAAADAHGVQLATAVLLVEVMRADRSIGDAERDAVVAALQRKFSLPADELERLIELAHEHQRSATDFHAFTSALNERFTDAQKLQVVEAMWEVAYADGHLEAHEQHVLWRVADLLHVPHGAYIGAKMRAKAAAAAASSSPGEHAAPS
jgi:uncharacterized tellurite resistance protein B-like protein